MQARGRIHAEFKNQHKRRPSDKSRTQSSPVIHPTCTRVKTRVPNPSAESKCLRFSDVTKLSRVKKSLYKYIKTKKLPPDIHPIDTLYIYRLLPFLLHFLKGCNKSEVKLELLFWKIKDYIYIYIIKRSPMWGKGGKRLEKHPASS